MTKAEYCRKALAIMGSQAHKEVNYVFLLPDEFVSKVLKCGYGYGNLQYLLFMSREIKICTVEEDFESDWRIAKNEYDRYNARGRRHRPERKHQMEAENNYQVLKYCVQLYDTIGQEAKPIINFILTLPEPEVAKAIKEKRYYASIDFIKAQQYITIKPELAYIIQDFWHVVKHRLETPFNSCKLPEPPDWPGMAKIDEAEDFPGDLL